MLGFKTKKLAQIYQNLIISKCFELNDFFKFGKCQITTFCKSLSLLRFVWALQKNIVDKISMYIAKKMFICKECEDKVNQKGYLIKHKNQCTQFLGLC